MQEWSHEVIVESLQKNKICLLYLYTPLCGTCQLAGKMLSVVTELLPHIEMGKADLNYLPYFAELWEIESVPCLIVFKDGQLVEKIYAFHSVPYLAEKIKNLL